MAIKKFIVGNFDDEAVLFPAVKKVRKAGYKIHDVYHAISLFMDWIRQWVFVIRVCILPGLFMQLPVQLLH